MNLLSCGCLSMIIDKYLFLYYAIHIHIYTCAFIFLGRIKSNAIDTNQVDTSDIVENVGDRNGGLPTTFFAHASDGSANATSCDHTGRIQHELAVCTNREKNSHIS